MLWQAVSAFQSVSSVGKKGYELDLYIYSGSKLSPEAILEEKVKKRFGIDIRMDNLHFVTIDEGMHRSLDPKMYPYVTMVF